MSTISGMSNASQSLAMIKAQWQQRQQSGNAMDLLEKPTKADPAGKAIAAKQEAQERASAMWARNKQSEIDMANVADGALAGVNDYLQDMNALSIQALNGTNSASDIQAIRNQQSQLAAGIDQIGAVTRYNETNPISNISSRNLGITQNFNTDDIGKAIDQVSAQRGQFGAETNGNEAAVRNLNTAAENTAASLNRLNGLE